MSKSFVQGIYIRIFLFTAIVYLLLGCVSNSESLEFPDLDNQAGVSNRSYTQVSVGSTDMVELDFLNGKLVLTNGKIYFLVDTGANATVVFEDFFIKQKQAENVRPLLRFRNKNLFLALSFNINELVFDEYPFVWYQNSGLSDDIMGVIGNDVLNSFSIIFSAKEKPKLMRFVDHLYLENKYKQVGSIYTDSLGLIYTDVNINDQNSLGIIDTGSSFPLIVSADYYEEYLSNLPVRFIDTSYGWPFLDQNKVSDFPVRIGYFRNIQVGGISFEGIPFLVVSSWPKMFSSKIVVSSQLFAGTNSLLSFEKMKVYSQEFEDTSERFRYFLGLYSEEQMLGVAGTSEKEIFLQPEEIGNEHFQSLNVLPGFLQTMPERDNTDEEKIIRYFDLKNMELISNGEN